MKKLYLLILASMFLYTCENPTSSESSENTSWVFVANEGNYGASNGTVSMIDDQGNMVETEACVDVIPSLDVYEDKLIVLIINSHMIKIFDITDEGLCMRGKELSIENFSTGEMVIFNDKVYFKSLSSLL